MSDDEKKRYWIKIRDMSGYEIWQEGSRAGWSTDQWQKVNEFRMRHKAQKRKPEVDIVSEALKVFPNSKIVS